MEAKMKAVRAGHKGAVTKLLRKFEDIQQSSEADNEEISTLLEAVTQKKRILENINEKILEQTSDEDVAVEILESDEYMFNLEYKLRQIKKLVKSVQNQSLPANEPVSSNLNPHADSFIQSVPSTFISKPSTSANQQYTHSSNSRASSSTNSEYHKLPKLNLPIFTGDILDWQSFWDSYETAIHTNPTLSDAQKFNYLKSLLQSEALQTIAGFSMTSTNYDKAISLLQERYGQTHKIVQTYMQALLDLQAPIHTITSLRSYYDKTDTYVRGLESLGQTDDTYGSLLVPVILNKLPAEIRQHLAREHRSTNWTLHDLRKALLDELNIMEAGKLPDKVERPLATATFLTSMKSRSNSTFGKPEKSVSDKKPFIKSCIFCHENRHIAVNCTKIITVDARTAVIKRERLCFNCLGRHKLAECKSTSTCKKCNKRHHTSICNTNNSMNESHEQVNEDNGKTVLHSSLAPHKTSNVILKTAVACVSSGTQSTDANILLDEGAQRSFVTESLARKLDLSINGTEMVYLSGFGEQNRQVRHMQSATIYLQTDDVENIPLEVLIIPEIALPIQTHMKSVVNMRHLHGLKLAHPITEDDMFNINLLIGADYYWSIVGDKIIRGNGPTAVESKLGYLLSGPTTSIRESNRSSILNVIVSHKAEECNLTKFWEIESLGIEDSNTNTELEEFQTIYENSSVSFLDNKYVAKLPWKTNHPPLPSNKAVAFRRTENVIRRLSKEPQLLQKYGEIIEEQEKRGFIEKVEEDLVKPNTKLHYIPHHAVKKDSATTPIRIVYDCSCRQTPDTASLIDCLLNVPPKLNNVTAILLRFRMNKYAVCTDLEKAFLNVGLDIEDRDVTIFFWLSNPTDPSSCITTYRFKSVLFGATCSPFILNAVLSKHINNHQTEFTDNLMRDLYADNIVSSFNSEDELSQYFKVVRKLFTDGGFNLRAWASNNKLLQQLAESEKVIDTEQVVKVLGLRWNTDQDTLKYAENILDTEIDLITKREVLRESFKIYDPLGIISPVTVRGKMCMQTLWGENMKWDEPLPDHMRTAWIDIRKDINEATKTIIHRHYFTNCSDSNSNNVIHVFMDASMKACRACAYLVSEGKSSLLMSRNRVAPLKQLTIPRLELMAAVIGSRLLSHILSHINVNRVILWSDSQIVLSWLSSNKTLKQFVANRVKEIKELTEKFTWKYCPSESNPAD